MYTLHLVSHTHWDREWYLTFQQFRLKLVHLVDNLLTILAENPEFRHFTLDGQTVVLEDYLHMRPEREAELRLLVQSGRLLIGPWHILPDEFLVSPEATLRNLLQGERTARRFGPKMMVGYIPDPFGHIAQMPQILSGFGIHTASVQRGLADEPCEFWWQAPDGSRVFMANLRDGYGSADALPTSDPERFILEIQELRDSLASHSAASHLLLMNGMDHREPSPEIPAAIAYANEHLAGGDHLLHSTMPLYLEAVQAEIARQDRPIPTLSGELRACKRHHLLPGVLSTRMWIKQRNHACQTLLEKWAEPFSTWAELAVENTNGRNPGYAQLSRIHHPAPILRQAWHLLMECHPHDSICGCSIDQVHAEMRPRFDQVEQIGEEIRHQSLAALASLSDTRPPDSPDSQPISAVVVYNPVEGPRTGLARVEIEFPAGMDQFEILDSSGAVLPHQESGAQSLELLDVELDPEGFRSALRMVRDGRIAGMVFRQLEMRQEGDQVWIEASFSENGSPNMAEWNRGLARVEKLLEQPAIKTYFVRARSVAATCADFVAREIPAYGYRTFWVRYLKSAAVGRKKRLKISPFMRTLMPLAGRMASLPLVGKLLPRAAQDGQSGGFSDKPPFTIQNEFLKVDVSPQNGTLTVQDKRSGVIYSGLNRFVDGGDCGDEYNYCPPGKDRLVAAQVQSIRVSRKLTQALQVRLVLQVPQGLSQDRQSRGGQQVALSVTTTASLAPGLPRLDIQTRVSNPAGDHRLRVHFPAPFSVEEADYDSHFQVIRRPIGLPPFDETWVEQPRPEKPQRLFTSVSDGKLGLTIANRGLPEVEVLKSADGNAEIALTLLRCVGWLSRDDFPNRTNHAGPMIATPAAQMPGEHTFAYAILPHPGDWRGAFPQAEAFNAPLQAVITPAHQGPLPAAGSMVAVEARSLPPEFASAGTNPFVLSAIKISEDEKGWIVRGYNLSASPLEVSLTPWRPFQHAARVNLAEADESTLTPGAGGEVTFQVGAYQIATLKFW